jgi:hypothetical protein
LLLLFFFFVLLVVVFVVVLAASAATLENTGCFSLAKTLSDINCRQCGSNFATDINAHIPRSLFSTSLVNRASFASFITSTALASTCKITPRKHEAKTMLSFASELSSISAAAESAFCSDTLFLFVLVSSSFDKSARKASDVDEDAGKRFFARDKEVSSASRKGDGSFGFLFLVVIFFLMPKRVWEKI